MEKLIAKNLYRRLELNFTQHDGWTLVDYVNHAKEVGSMTEEMVEARMDRFSGKRAEKRSEEGRLAEFWS